MRYEYKCCGCGVFREVQCMSTQRESRIPSCCGQPMARDFHAEHFAGVTHRNKGVYPLHDPDFNGGTTFDSYQHHKRELQSKGMTWKPRSTESLYRQKHTRDIK